MKQELRRQQDKVGNNTMTTRKYNAIVKLCKISNMSNTFAAILKAVKESFDTDKMTAEQIARAIEFGYAQKEFGYWQGVEEMK